MEHAVQPQHPFFFLEIALQNRTGSDGGRIQDNEADIQIFSFALERLDCLRRQQIERQHEHLGSVLPVQQRSQLFQSFPSSCNEDEVEALGR
jgi:hypothetical protein